MEELFRKIVGFYTAGDEKRKAQVLAFCRNLQNYDYHLRQVEGKLDAIIVDAMKAEPTKD